MSWLELFGIVLNCLELLKSYKWTGWTGLDWMDPAEKPSPLRAPAVLKICNLRIEKGLFARKIVIGHTEKWSVEKGVSIFMEVTCAPTLGHQYQAFVGMKPLKGR